MIGNASHFPSHLHLPAAALALLLWSMAPPAYALDARKAAAAMAEQAATAFQTGDLARSAQFYLQAFRQDPSEPSYLYGAARAEHMAGRLEPAEEHYRQFIAAKGADSQRIEKTRGYLRELALARADAKAEDADRSAQKGAWKVAAAVWLDAWHIAPERQRYLFKAARAQHEAGDTDAAIVNLRAYLRDTPPDASDRGEAQALLDQMTAPPKPAAATSPAAPTPEAVAPVPAAVAPVLEKRPAAQPVAQPVARAPVVVAPAVPPKDVASGGNLAKWTLGGGAVLAAAGLGLVGWGLVEAADYRTRLNYDGANVRGKLTYDQAAAEIDTIHGHWLAGGILAGVGIAAAGWGAWSLRHDASNSAVLVPLGQGVALVGRF